MKRLHWIGALPLAFALVANGPGALARQDTNRPARPEPLRQITAGDCQVSSSRAELDINNVRAMVLNGGDMWWNLNDARYEVPKVTDPNSPRRYAIFAGSVWVGGQDPQGNLYTAVQTYRQGGDVGWWPGPLDDQGQINRAGCAAWDNHAKINRVDIDNWRASVTPPIADPNTIPQAIREWPGKDNPYLNRANLSNVLAPFVDTDNDGQYDPAKGDYPDILGDQAIWWVMNDVGNTKSPQSEPIGLELSVMAFGFETNDLLNNMTFYKQRVANKRSLTLKNTYFGQWVDPDLGYFNDDFVGCDVGRGLGFCYNGDNLDEGVSGYGANPPTIAVDFFEGPVADPNDGIDNDRDAYDAQGIFHQDSIDEAGEKIIMSNFVYYNNDFSVNGNPEISDHFYNYLRSKIRDGSDLKFGGDGLSGTTGERYAFMFPGGGCNPSSDPFGYGYANPPTNKRPPYAWSESNTDNNGGQNLPGDRRFLQSAGPFTLTPGAVNQITIGVIWGSAGSGGPQGSNGLVCYADDQAQAAFDNDFKIPEGPPTPIVKRTELDQQIVLAIQPATPAGKDFNTETYSEFISGRGLYKFEGYQIYQLANEQVTAADVSDPDKARLVARGDVVNGVGRIIAQEFDISVGQVVPVLKVDDTNADKGIFHTLNITTDLFAEGNSRLVNFKQYNYLIVPYAYSSENQDLPYLQGRRATKISAIPHKTEPERNGTILNSAVYGNVPVKRIWGTGTGRNVLEITQQDEDDIVANKTKREITYEAGHSPVNVRIYDPKLAKAGQFNVKLTSRLVYDTRSVRVGSRPVQVGDIIVSTGQYATAETKVTPRTPNNKEDFSSNAIDRSIGPQIPGRAIVRRIVSVGIGSYKTLVRARESANPADTTTRISQLYTDRVISENLVTLEIEMLNDEQGGTFMAAIEERKDPNELDNGQRPPTPKADLLLDYDVEPRPFITEDNGFEAVAREYALHDYWTLTNLSTTPNTVIRADRPVSDVNEQLVPDYGLSISVTGANNPGFQSTKIRSNQFQEASLTFTGEVWLTGVPFEKASGTPPSAKLGRDWLLDPDGDELKTFDFGGTFVKDILPTLGQGSTYTAYPVSKAAGSGGAGYVQESEQVLYRLRNVDIVYTADKSKWSRCPVLQINSGFRPSLDATKFGSKKPSVDKDGNPTGERSPYRADSISRGMSWFPGYAIDLDRGVRLNVMFAESRVSQNDGKGNDLKWEPNSNQDGGRNYVYVMDTEYDEGRANELFQDRLLMKFTPQLDAKTKKAFADSLFSHVTWIGYPKLVAGRQVLPTNSVARVRLRVNRRFESYPGGLVDGKNTNPEYTFGVTNEVASTEQKSFACDKLSLVRVVPNPYYAFSQYEQRQVDNIVKVTNLPRRCDVTIYTLAGVMVRRLRKDDDRTFIDWNLKNDSGLPIASGAYIVHINAPDLNCERVVKWFGVLRPIDLDSF